MDPRYSGNDAIKKTWTTEQKLLRWQQVELAVIDARAKSRRQKERAARIRGILEGTPIDVEWWKARDKEIHHDLQAFVDERRRHLPRKLQRLFHKDITSYDTEEPAFATALNTSVAEVERLLGELATTLVSQIGRYRFLPMLGVTHGQWAELQTLGKRMATWLKALIVDKVKLDHSKHWLGYSKLSGAIGNSGEIPMTVQTAALAQLGLEPFAGATQIMPREVYVPLAEALAQIVETTAKMAIDIRLAARSARTLMQEPFGKSQKGSSAMPHKKNTITLEQISGMAIMARQYANMIAATMSTWEERAIEQSCVERVAWPDLFFVVTHTLARLTKVIADLRVYPDRLLQEIVDCRGVYAANRAKGFLGESGFEAEVSYRIVQLAAFNAFEPSRSEQKIRDWGRFTASDEAERAPALLAKQKRHRPESIQDLIKDGKLRPSAELGTSRQTVTEWNRQLRTFFGKSDRQRRWAALFSFERNLQGEEAQIEEVLKEAGVWFGIGFKEGTN